MPGDLEGSPALTFAPLPLAEGGDAAAGLAGGDDGAALRGLQEVMSCKPFFRDHFARLDRQIVLVDALAALNSGPEAVRDLQAALDEVLAAFRIGRGNALERAVPAENRPDSGRGDQGRPSASPQP